jgi:hypothetical protein
MGAAVIGASAGVPPDPPARARVAVRVAGSCGWIRGRWCDKSNRAKRVFILTPEGDYEPRNGAPLRGGEF